MATRKYVKRLQREYLLIQKVSLPFPAERSQQQQMCRKESKEMRKGH